MTFPEIEKRLDGIEASLNRLEVATSNPIDVTQELLRLSEAVLEQWIEARELSPTHDKREGFRLLALHRQGSRGEPSFNACRETCRELCYYHNLIASDQQHPDTVTRLKLATMVAKHLFLFVSGKMQVESLGEFCCSSRPIRSTETEPTGASATD